MAEKNSFQSWFPQTYDDVTARAENWEQDYPDDHAIVCRLHGKLVVDWTQEELECVLQWCEEAIDSTAALVKDYETYGPQWEAEGYREVLDELEDEKDQLEDLIDEKMVEELLLDPGDESLIYYRI